MSKMALRVARGMSAILSLSDQSGHWPEVMLNESVEIDPNRRFATANYRIAKGLFDHLVGRQEWLWEREAERIGGLQIDDKL